MKFNMRIRSSKHRGPKRALDTLSLRGFFYAFLNKENWSGRVGDFWRNLRSKRSVFFGTVTLLVRASGERKAVGRHSKLFPLSFLCCALAAAPAATTVASEANSPSAAPEHEIWLAPQSLPPPPAAQDADFMSMFTPSAPWSFTSSHTQVFKLYGSYLPFAAQDEINTVVADLNQRGIDIALEVGVMNVGPATTNPPCGGMGVLEGYGTPFLANLISAKIKEAGGQIKYIVMDEPIYYGHYYDGPHACQNTLNEILNLVTPTLAAYIDQFPDVIIGEAEPASQTATYPGWQNDLLTWATMFKQTLGAPLAFMQLDILWTNGPIYSDLQNPLAYYAEVKQLQSQGLIERVGIIHDASPLDTTDAAWAQDTRNHIMWMEGHFGLRPDQDIFQSFLPNPTHALPESDPEALTSLVPWYHSMPFAQP